MNKVSRLVFIVYAAALFSSNVFAKDDYFFVLNNSSWTIDIKATSEKYCVYYTTPYEKRLETDSHVTFMVAYNTAGFTKCNFYHSSQEFDITFTLGNVTYATTFEWYKPVNRAGKINLPTFPGYLSIKAKIHYGDYFDKTGPIVTIDNL